MQIHKHTYGRCIYKSQSVQSSQTVALLRQRGSHTFVDYIESTNHHVQLTKPSRPLNSYATYLIHMLS